MLMAMPDPNGTGQLYLQPLPPQLQIHKASGAMPAHHNVGSEGVALPTTNMFLRQRSNAVSIRARRNREQENRSSFYNGPTVVNQIHPHPPKNTTRDADNNSTPNIGNSRRSRMQRFSSEFSTKEYDFSDTKLNNPTSNQIKHMRHEKDVLDKRSKSQGKEIIDNQEGLGIHNDKLNGNRIRTGQKVNREWRRQRAYSDEWDRPSPPKDMDIPLSKDENTFSRTKAERKSINAIAGYFRSNSSDGKHNLKDMKKINSKKTIPLNTNGTMETLDRRISASTDQLDTLTRRTNDHTISEDVQKRFRRKSNCYSLDDSLDDHEFDKNDRDVLQRNKNRLQARPASGLEISRQPYSQQKTTAQAHPQRPKSATRFTGRSHFLSTLANNNRDPNNNNQGENSKFDEEYTFNYRGEKISRSRYFFGNSAGKNCNNGDGQNTTSDNNNNVRNSNVNIFARKHRIKDDSVAQNREHKNSVNEDSDKGMKKTAVDIFLEDEGPYSRKLYGPVPPLPQEDVTSSSGGSSGGKKSGNSSGSGGSAINKNTGAAVINEQTNYNKRKLRAKSQEIILESSDDLDIYGSSAEGSSDPTLLVSSGIANDVNIKKGLLWQQKDKIFSRWKERFFILTKDYFHCFKKGNTRLTEMGGFIFKLKLAEIDTAELLDKRGYLTVCISLLKEGKIYLRRPEGIREWYNALQNNIYECKRRRQFWVKRQITDSANIEQWLLARQKVGMQYPYSSNNNADITRSNIKSNNNTEHQPRDTKESNIGDINHKSGRPRDTGKPEDTSSHGTFAINNAQSTKQQPRVGSNNGAVHHRQGDYTDIGNKASHPAQVNNIGNKKKMLDIQDQHSSRYDDSSKKLGSTPKICQSVILTNNGNGIGGNTKSENHPFNNNRMPQETKLPSNSTLQIAMSSSAHPPPPTGFTNPPLSSSSSNSSAACSPTPDKNKPSMTQHYLLHKQRDNNLANNSLRPTNLSNTDVVSHPTPVAVNNTSTGNNANQRGSGINRMSLVSELIMKEKLQKCSSSTGSETSEEGGIAASKLSKKEKSEMKDDKGNQNQQNNCQQNTRYIPLNLSLGTSVEKLEFNKSTLPSPSSSSSGVQPSTSSASSSSLSSDPPAGKCTDKGIEHRNNSDNISGLPNNASTIVLRRQRLDDSGNDSGHNSIMTNSDTQSDGTNSSGEEQRSPSKIRSNPPSPLALKKADSHDSKDLDSISPPSNTECRPSVITITQTNQPAKQTAQSAVHISTQINQSQIPSTTTITTKLSPIKMVQPLGFPNKLPPPPPQYQTTSTSSSNLLKSTLPSSSKDQKPSPTVSEKPPTSSCISNISRFKAQFQSSRSLDSDMVLATASAIASSNNKESVGTNDTSEEMQEIPQQLPDAAKLLPMVRHRESRISARKSLHRRTYAFGQVITEV